MDNIRNEVNEIKDKIKSLNAELISIQNTCKHEKVMLKYNEETKNVLKVCDICGKIIGYPTQEELKDSDFT